MRMRYALSPLPPGPLFIPCSNPLCIYVPDRMNHSLLKKSRIPTATLSERNRFSLLCVGCLERSKFRHVRLAKYPKIRSRSELFLRPHAAADTRSVACSDCEYLRSSVQRRGTSVVEWEGKRNNCVFFFCPRRCVMYVAVGAKKAACGVVIGPYAPAFSDIKPVTGTYRKG